MQAHANDLRSEIANDFTELVDSITIGAGDVTGRPAVDDCDAFVHQAVREWTGLPVKPAVRSLLEYAAHVTHDPASCTPQRVNSLRAAGWSDRAIHDAVQIVAYFNYINRIADALGVELEPDLPHWGD